MLKLESLRVTIDGVQVLRDLSFELPKGKVTVLIGRNGAGKTTTLRSMMGLMPIDGGKVLMDDINLVDLPPMERARRGIGYAPEDRRLIGSFSIEENICLPGLALKLSKAEIASRLAEIYEVLPELSAMRSRPGSGVSGGQGKMVALGRALMVARTALLLDEPFQGLAPALALEYARTLSKVREARTDLTLLVTESTPKLLDAIADQTLQIERGTLVEGAEAQSGE